LDTVGSETPASAAMAAMVVRRFRLACSARPVPVGFVLGTSVPSFA